MKLIVKSLIIFCFFVISVAYAQELTIVSATDNGQSEHGHGPENAIDNNYDPESRWSQQFPAAITLELGVLGAVTDVAIAWHKGDQRTAQFEIETSTDGAQWVNVFPYSSSSGTTLNLENYDVVDTTARYVRILGNGNTENEWNSIVEVKVMDANTGLNPNVSPGGNFELIDWYLSTPEKGRYDDDEFCYKAKRIDGTYLAGGNGYQVDNYFLTAADGGMVFRATVAGHKTSCETNETRKYVRTELREMLSRGIENNTKHLSNNWVFSTAPNSIKSAAAGIDGKMEATISVNHVTTTGSDNQVGKVIIGQIHASEDEPLRLYYRKLPGNTNGSIYFAHEVSRLEPCTRRDIWFELIGSRADDAPNPDDGIALNEKFSYEIVAQGNSITVRIMRDGKPDVVRTVDISESCYDVAKNYKGENEFMYFKAGAYLQDNTGQDNDFAKVTFYELENSHNNNLPQITSPNPREILTGSNQTFSWNPNGNVIEQWALYAGSFVGGSDYHVSGAIDSATSTTAFGLPTDGSQVYVRFWYRVGADWKSLDVTYTAATIAQNDPPQITSPAPNSILSGASQTFSWNPNGNVIEQWALLAGSSPGASDYHVSGAIDSATSTTVYGLPTDGSQVYVQFWYRVGTVWKSLDVTYTAATIVQNDPPQITNPSPNSILSGVSQVFSWDPNSNAIEQWALLAGSSPGASDYHVSGAIDSSISSTVSGLPTDGSDVYVRFWYKIDGIWGNTDVIYTALNASGIYIPSPSTTWQWQLQGTVDTSYDVELYDIDLFDSSLALIQQLQAQGRKVICYFSAGSYEDWRDDADQLAASDLGNTLNGFPDEHWLDIRSTVVKDIMKNRLDIAVSKGCDGVEPDNMDGYTNDPGFPLTAADQLTFNRMIASEAHSRNLSVGLKNDLDQINDLVDDFDFAVNEQCHQYNECDLLAPFINAGKAVLNAEYDQQYIDDASARNALCQDSQNRQFSTIILPEDLDNSLRFSCL